MNPAEVVAGEVQAERGPEVVSLLAEGVRQPRQPANLHRHCEILALDVGRTEPVAVGIAECGAWQSPHNIGGAVALFAFARNGTYLDGHSEVHAV